MRNLYCLESRALLPKLLLCALFVLWSAQAARAAFGDTVDFGEMALDTPYELKQDFSDYCGHFVAPKSGLLSVEASTGCLMLPFADEGMAESLDYTHSYMPGGEMYNLAVEEGKTYYFKKSFCMADGTCTLRMEEAPEVVLVGISPAEGSVYDLTANDLFSVSFNRPVNIGSAWIIAGGQEVAVEAHVSGVLASVDASSTVFSMLESGQLSEGDGFALELRDIRSVADASVLYGTDGTLHLSYFSPGMPLRLLSAKGAEDNTFLSYWPKADERGIVTLEFDGDLLPVDGREEEAVATISYGNLEAEGAEYYVETLPYAVEGNVLQVDLTDKLRRPKDMVASATDYGTVALSVRGVRDIKGNYAYSPVAGSQGSFSYSMPYEEVKTDILSEFIPASGASLAGVDEIEIWITDYEKLRHEGILFTVTHKEETSAFVSNDFTATPDPDYEGAYILKVPVPAGLAGNSEVEVTLNALQALDGIDHAADLTAVYKVPTAISRVEVQPTAGAEVYSLSGLKVGTGRKLPAGIYVVGKKKILIGGK